MPTQHQRIQQRLKAFDFAGLFTQELMWNHFPTRPLEIPIDGTTYTLTSVAQRGMAVFECVPPTDAQFPKYAIRRKIDTQVSKAAREHIIIFHDLAKTVQVWQWVKREAGKQSACREQLFYTGQSGDALIQKIQSIAFGLDDEANITETVVRVGAAFDVEKVTKKFYELFKKEHDTFLKFTKGIPDDKLERWYASVMLNRLMFIYFIQKKGFLGGDQHYLKNKLSESQRRGRDRFYREVLRPLFFEGFAKREEQRSAEINRLLGRVPYLNGGLFLKHQIEELHGKSIEIADKAFEKIFDFFEQYDWYLDDRPTRTGREINPDVLGYVFEKYINQREMGAYYTKEDITDYISKNTILPALFDMAKRSCKIAFEGDHSVWRLLRVEPDRYIHAPLLKGLGMTLPADIEAGHGDPSKRAEWNRPAGDEFALPMETWREVLSRRSRCEEIRSKLKSGQICSINDLISQNLDIRRFAEEVIANCEGPELLRAFYKAVRTVSILDPTCGSGAFLFAALSILEQLYDTCLVRMQAFVDDLDRSEERHSIEKFKDFRQTLEEMNDKTRHPSPRYFVLKSIILNNLYGVDIMEEATEICKLRLFLKLVAQVNAGDKIEPLPDIDFNIRTGNTLVGFATASELDNALSRLGHGEKKAEIEERAEAARLAFERFRQNQVVGGTGSPEEMARWKAEVNQRLSGLREELDDYLAGEYNVKKGDKRGLSIWRQTHQVFHWFVEFFGIMTAGGFDAVIGNPPYVEYSKVRAAYAVKRYETEPSGNLYNYVTERSTVLLRKQGWLGLIIPLGAFSTNRMETFQDFVCREYRTLFLSYFSGDAHPSVLFEGVKYRLAIIIGQREYSNGAQVFTSGYLRWYADERPHLFSKIAYELCDFSKGYLRFAKLGSPQAKSVLLKILKRSRELGQYIRKRGAGVIHYHRSPVFWIRAMTFEPFFHSATRNRSEDHLRDLFFDDPLTAISTGGVLNSTTFYFWFVTQGNCRDVAGPDVIGFPIGDLSLEVKQQLASGCTELMSDLQRHSRRRVYVYETSGRVEYDEFYPKMSKTFIDTIDFALAQHYGLTNDEVDWLVNFDIKYRMGRDVLELDEESESTDAAASSS